VPDPPSEIRLHVSGDEDADAEYVADLATGLRRELLELDVDRVDHAPGAPAPIGAKGQTLEWAQLVVTLAGSMPAFVGVVQAWLGRHPGCSVTFDVDGDTFTVKGLSAADRDRLAEDWLRKHGIE
jgi:Effector Associated Constant Component 1